MNNMQKKSTKVKKAGTCNKIKNVLSISNVDNNILILLNNEEVINLKVKKWRCLLEDIGSPFLPATVPTFPKDD